MALFSAFEFELDLLSGAGESTLGPTVTRKTEFRAAYALPKLNQHVSFQLLC